MLTVPTKKLCSYRLIKTYTFTGTHHYSVCLLLQVNTVHLLGHLHLLEHGLDPLEVGVEALLLQENPLDCLKEVEALFNAATDHAPALTQTYMNNININW